MSIDIGNVNAAACFLRIVARDLAARNGDMSTVSSGKSSAAMIAITIMATEIGIFIVSDVATGNSDAAAFGHDAATKASRIKRAVAGDYAISYSDRGAFSIHTTATISAVAGNYATGQIKGRGTTFLVGNHNARARGRARSATHIAAAHVDSRAVLGIDQAANAATLFLRDHAAHKFRFALPPHATMAPLISTL